MDGKTARLFTENLIRAVSKATIVNRKLTYDLLHMGAEEFVSLTGCIKESMTITSVDGTAAYDLNANFLKLYLKDKNPKGGEFFILYNDGTTTYTVYFKSYQSVIFDNETTEQSIPSYFTLLEKTSLPDQVTGTITSAGAVSGGQSTLNDSATTLSDNVSPRDIVHNATRDASGIVLTVSTNSATTAMFDSDGNPVGWDSNDSYVIQPVHQMQMQFVPPSSTSGHTATVYYVAKPAPVYTDYGTWQIQDQWHKAFCYWAADAYLAQYEIDDPKQGVQLLAGKKYMDKFNDIVRRAKYDIDKSLRKTGYSMRSEVNAKDNN